MLSEQGVKAISDYIESLRLAWNRRPSLKQMKTQHPKEGHSKSQWKLVKDMAYNIS